MEKLYFFPIIWLLVTIFMEVRTTMNKDQTVNELHTCFVESMHELVQKDSSLAVLLNPETDQNIIATIFPMIKINLTDIPTEYKADNSSDYVNLVSFSNDNDNIGQSNSSLLIPVNGIEFLSLPQEERRSKIRYLLFTKENKDQYQVMPEDGTIEDTKWRSERKTKILIHGLSSSVWLPSIVNIWTQNLFEIKNAYLKRTPDASLYNVLVVDWTSLSTVPLARYPEAALATREAGKDLAEFLIKLKNSKNILDWEDVHLIGHSLGAHLAGIAGNELRKRGNEYVLGRITGLDPAGLCFDTNSAIENPEIILDSSDAKFVDIIHTNMGNVVKSVASKYGTQLQTGHADFYPNGGEMQKGCSYLQDRLNFCSHQKSVELYATSIWNKSVACSCKSWDIFRSNVCNCKMKAFMGEHCNNASRGKYFLSI